MERATDKVDISKEARLSVELRIGTGGSELHCDGAPSEEVNTERRASEEIPAMVALQTSEMPIRSIDLPTKHKVPGMALPHQQAPQAAG